MNTYTKSLVKGAAVLVLLIWFGLLSSQEALAAGSSDKDTIPAGTTIDDDRFLRGEDVTVAGVVNGDVVAVGSTITVSGTIDGSLIALGGRIEITGNVTGSVYALGGSIDLLEPAEIEHSLYFIGLSINFEEGATIVRDLNALSLGAVIRGTVERETFAVVGLIKILRIIFDRTQAVESGTGALLLPSNQQLKLTAARIRQLPLMMALPLPGISQSPTPTAVAETTTNPAVGDWFLNRLLALIPLLLLGLPFLWIAPTLLNQAASWLRRKPLLCTGRGLVGITTGYLTILLAALLVSAVVLLFFALGLSTLTWLVGATAGSAVLLAAGLLSIAVGYLSKIVVAFLLGSLILQLVRGELRWRSFWALLLGSVVYVLLTAIPYAGLAISIVAAILGFGALWLAAFHAWRTRNEAEFIAASEGAPVE